MDKVLKQKLTGLPKEPGVYFHKNIAGEIIYVGKAAVLRNRVRQYFQKSRSRDVKTSALVAEIHDTDWMVVESELEALFLEAEMIRRYMPQYNILLRDDKSLSYIRISYDSDYPTVGITRRPLDDGAKYFGPYFSASSTRQALKILRKIFPYATRKMPNQKRANLHYHLGLDPGLEEGKTTLKDYRANLRRLMSVIEGKRLAVQSEIERDMKNASKAQNFELAAKLRNQIFHLKNLNKQVIFSDKEFMDISKDHALSELVSLLGLTKLPARIEGYDVSHMSGTDVVASMVVFTNGVSNKAQYRKFKTKKDQNNDFYNMNETIKRRLSSKNIDAWGMPDLILIDGGKGQLDAAIVARTDAQELSPKNLGITKIPMIGLAKREEELIIHKELSHVSVNSGTLIKMRGYSKETTDFITVTLPQTSHCIKLLQRIRDESHRFAVSYHSTLKQNRVSKSQLDEVPGIGPKTKKKLLLKYGSLRAVALASETELSRVVGPKIAKALKKQL